MTVNLAYVLFPLVVVAKKLCYGYDNLGLIRFGPSFQQYDG